MAVIDKKKFESTGFVVASGLFRQAEARILSDHFMRLGKTGGYSDDIPPRDDHDHDPLKQYPRLMQMHHSDQASLDWLLEPRIEQCMLELLGAAPYAVQTMAYFKPPQARGQALHQDQYYLNAHPGTCIAAWMALDDCEEENGCLQVVPGTHQLPVLCVEDADYELSFTDVTVPLPAEMEPVPVVMEAGDVLFFNGQLIHGSLPNDSKDRFRRVLIGHYIYAEAEQVHEFYYPALRFDGSEVTLENSERGGECGVWVDRQGQPEVELISPSVS